MIGIDITATQNQTASRGIGVLAKSFVNLWVQLYPEEIVLFGFDGYSTINTEAYIQADIPFISLGRVMPLTPLTTFAYRVKLHSAIRNYNREHTSEKEKITKFFSPFIHSGVAYIRGITTYVYVHDLIQKEIGIYSPKGVIQNLIKKREYEVDWIALSQARGIFTTSAYVQQQLKEYYGYTNTIVVPPGIDHQIYNPTHIQQMKSVYSKYIPLDAQYVLYYGGDEPNKNIPFLLNVFHSYRKEYTQDNLYLIILGKGFEQYKDDSSKEMLKENSHIVYTGFVDEEEKLGFIKDTRLFMHFSLSEGFGIAVCENIASGVVCLVSENRAYKEFFDSGVAFVSAKPTTDACLIARDMMHTLLYDTDMRRRLIHNGMEKVGSYSWESSFSSLHKAIYG